MEFVETRDLEVVILGPIGRLEAACCQELEAKLAELLQGGIRTFLIDFAEVESVSAAALRVLIAFARRLEPMGGQVLLSSLSESVAEVFEIAGLGSVFALAKSRREAALELGRQRILAATTSRVARLLGLPLPGAPPDRGSVPNPKLIAPLADRLARALAV